MKIFAIEYKITLLILIIVAAIIATGYLSYKNLSHIVYSIHREARPDYKLMRIKQITSDLSDADNSVRLYSLTREPKYLRPYNKIISSADKGIEELLKLQGNDSSQIKNIHAIELLIGERLVVWDQILRLHSKPLEKEVFSEFYNTIEKKTNDTLTLKKSNILQRFFKRKKDVTLGKEEVQQEVAKLEKSLLNIASQKAETESKLLQKNNELGSKLQFLILQLEQKETESLFIKSLEAEILAQQTYRWLAIFCLAAVVLLIVVLFIIINYSRKSFQSQQLLRKAKIEADNLIKVKELFTANVSHELRTPMNAIYGLSEQLLQQPMDDKLKEQLSVIKKSADYLNKIVNDILDFSKIEAGKLTIESIPFNPLKVFEEVCVLNQVIADQKNIDFKCIFSEKLPAQIIGDPTRLRQIILNLLNNAFKFTEQGEVSISVDADQPVSGSSLIAISISDTGIGISPEKLSSVFDDYSQAEQSINRRYGGTGLGLSIVKRLVDLMHGTVEVRSIQHQGTVFTCRIPFEVSNNIAAPENDQIMVNVPEDLRDVSILVADDEEYNRMLLATIFKKWKSNYSSVSNGKDAVKLSHEKKFDIILMDIRMPHMNGYDASKEILTHSPNTKIIALTAGNYADDLKKCKDAGIVGFLLKPFSEKNLIETILETMGKNTIPYVKNREIYILNNNIEDINLEELYRVADGDEHFVDEMLNLFLKTTHEGMDKLKQNLETNNWVGLSETAHKMAPPCRHLGADSLYRNLKELERIEFNSDNYLKTKNLIEFIESQIIVISSKIGQKIA